MKKVLLLTLALMVIASFAMAQTGGHIGLYSDLGYVDCTLDNLAFGLCPVYVVHQLTSAKGAQFKIDNNAGLVLAGTVFNHALNNGDPFVGYSVVYDGGCNAAPVLILTINFFCQGIAPPCSTVSISNDPTVTDILGLDCDNIERIATGGTLTVRPDQTCQQDCLPNPVSNSSWGKVKALYN